MKDSKKRRYYAYSECLKNKYGQKVYKLPINIKCSCPNRDGNIGFGGCTYCGVEGAGFENLSSDISVRDQIRHNMDYIGSKYSAKKFIAYFQNYTNTYMRFERFKEIIKEACAENIVEIAISTRPDCISEQQLDFLDEIQNNKGINITIELGIQTVNYHSLYKINRGHTLAEFINAVIKIKSYGFSVCAHLILNLPWDNIEDTIENAKILSVLKIDHIKLHSLYIIEGTPLGEEYLEGKINIISSKEYVERVITFLEYLSPDISIQRFLGRAPEKRCLFSNWGMSWWKIRDTIYEEMEKRDIYQGDKVDYLNGKALKKFL
jgi:radical SAM protein (TIGR01212 family)